MDNFELMFGCRMADGSIVRLVRIVAAPDLDWAKDIGYAMQGELVAPGQWLDYLLRAAASDRVNDRPSELTLGTPRLLPYAQLWRRVLHMLNLRPAGVKWVYSWRIGVEGEEPEIVGFFPWTPATD